MGPKPKARGPKKAMPPRDDFAKACGALGALETQKETGTTGPSHWLDVEADGIAVSITGCYSIKFFRQPAPTTHPFVIDHTHTVMVFGNS